MAELMPGVFAFTFLYPFLMAYAWILGSVIFRLFRKKNLETPPQPVASIPFSILVPCHNEAQCLEETIYHLMRQNYPEFEVIAIDDASTDRTPEILQELQEQYSRLRVIRLNNNQGKGMGLNMGALISRYEYLLGIDADAILDPEALNWMAWHFQYSPRVGAVTGNPKVRNRTSMLAKIQVGEFSSIIGMIKRTQRILGKVYTVSGVIAAFRKKALLNVGFWSNNMVTEDIDISWKIQLNYWDVRYEPRSLCWILVPETVKGILKQRLRWAQGGNEVLLKYYDCLFRWRDRRIWPLYVEYFLSVLWCYCFFLTILLFIAHFFIDLPPSCVVKSVIPGWTGVVIALTCLLQFGVGLIFDARYDKSLRKLVVWLIWYPAVYWLLNCAVTIVALPKAILKPRWQRAVWESPDRGLS